VFLTSILGRAVACGGGLPVRFETDAPERFPTDHWPSREPVPTQSTLALLVAARLFAESAARTQAILAAGVWSRGTLAVRPL